MRRQQGSVVDGIVVVVSSAMILSILDDSFADRSYLVAGLVPVVLLVSLALAIRRVHEGGWWYSLVGLAGFVPVGALGRPARAGAVAVPHAPHGGARPDRLRGRAHSPWSARSRRWSRADR